MKTVSTAAPAPPRLESAALWGLLAFAAALQISIAAAQILLTATFLLWVALVVTRRERVELPAFMWPLIAYTALTLVAVVFSRDPRVSFAGSKEVALFVVPPIVYRLARGGRTLTVTHVMITVGAASALAGVVQYGILEYDHLGRRPQGALTHYMTYSGLLMLVTTLAAARLLFRREDRTWPALVMPALLVALALTFTRSAWVGTCVGIGTLLVLKDLRLIAILPVLGALFIALSPPAITSRIYSMFDLHDPTNRDRIAMARAGARMIRERPLTGLGPDIVQQVYPEYRDASAVQAENPHLHNVPMQIAAERGLPALGAWIWFVAVVVRDLLRRMREPAARMSAAAGLAAMASMLAAGLFEYNFGDSEFLMALLVIITLPYAATRPAPLNP